MSLLGLTWRNISNDFYDASNASKYYRYHYLRTRIRNFFHIFAAAKELLLPNGSQPSKVKKRLLCTGTGVNCSGRLIHFTYGPTLESDLEIHACATVLVLAKASLDKVTSNVLIFLL